MARPPLHAHHITDRDAPKERRVGVTLAAPPGATLTAARSRSYRLSSHIARARPTLLLRVPLPPQPLLATGEEIQHIHPRHLVKTLLPHLRQPSLNLLLLVAGKLAPRHLGRVIRLVGTVEAPDLGSRQRHCVLPLQPIRNRLGLLPRRHHLERIVEPVLFLLRRLLLDSRIRQILPTL